MASKPEQLQQFLEALYIDGPPGGGHLLLWELDKMRGKNASYWFQDLDRFAAEALRIQNDVYIGTCTRRKAMGQYERGKPSDCLHMPALWLDIDWYHPVHKKKDRLPPTMEAAISLANALPYRPSAIINSGHGIQAWWFIDMPFEMSTEMHTRRAEDLSQRWALLAREVASEHGWDIDSVFNLDRIMRIPGTTNAKDMANTVDCTLVEVDEKRRYDIDELETVVQAIRVKPKASRVEKEIVGVGADAEPPTGKLDIACENDNEFRKRWEGKSTAMAGKSPSEYDLSLASYLVRYQWTDEEITAALVYWRKKHRQPAKVDSSGNLRLEYYARTIAKAKMGLAEVDAMDKLQEYASDDEALLDNETKRDALRQLGNLFRFRVDRIERHTADEPTYEIFTELGNIQLGGIDSIMSQNVFRKRIAAATGRVIGKVKQDEWDNVAQVILNACMVVDIGPEATKQGRAMAWVSQFLEDRNLYDEPQEAIGSKQPFYDYDTGLLYIFLAELRQWLNTSPYGDKSIGAKELGQHLRSIGGRSEILPYNGSTRSVFSLPNNVAMNVMPPAHKKQIEQRQVQ